MFSMIIGELIRATHGRTIYIATIFHAAMTFALVFLFSEETGDLLSMKVIALSTTIVGVLFIIISLIIRAIAYKTTKQSLDEVQPNNYLDHTEEDDFESHKNDSVANKEDNNSEASSEHSNTSDTDLKDSAKYTEDRHSSVVSDVKKEINQVEEQDISDSTKKE